MKFQYSRDNAVTWTTLPTGNVTLAGTTITAWPVTTSVAGGVASAPAQLAWDAKATLGGDAPVQLRAVFTGGTGWTTTNNPIVSLDTKAYGLTYGTVDVGIGSVSLVTGNLAVSSTDASVSSFGGSVAVSRTFNTLDPAFTPTSGPAFFGPGWSTTLSSEQSTWAVLEDLGAQVRVTDADGGKWYFTKTGSTYLPVNDAATAGYTLTVTGTTTLVFTLTDTGGGTVVFNEVAAGGTPSLTTPKPYRPVSSAQTGVTGGSTYFYNADGTPQEFAAPAPTGVTCTATTINIGCRELAFTYTGTGSATRLSKITLKTKDDAGTAITTDVACYTYDGTTANQLSTVWDPRVKGTGGWGTTCGTATLATTYSYDGAGRMATVQPPGLEPVHMSYDGNGRTIGVDHTHNATFGSNTLTTTIKYGVSIAAAVSTDDSHPDLSPARIAAWGQSDVPLTATVVFSPGDAVSATDLRDGVVTATDANGRTTNTATYSGTGQDGWRVDTSEYDTNGNTIRSLSAANRDRALNPGNYATELTGLGLGGASSQRIATALDTRTAYTVDGMDATDSYGPAHIVALPGGTVLAARAHTHTDYGTVNYPTVTPTDWTTGGPLHSPVQTTETASLSLDAVATNDTDATQIRTAYGLTSTDHPGWDLAVPMATTTENGTTDITTQTRYNSAGNVIEQRQPSAAGATANPGTRVTTYYTTGVNNPAACTSTAWYGQVCSTTPGAQPTTGGLPGLVSTTYTYDSLLRPTVAAETVTPSGGGTSTRTTTTTYGNSGASSQVASVSTSGGVGTAVTTQSMTYHATTGLPDIITGMSANTEVTGYDDFGQPVSYTDGHGAKTLTTYDTAGRVGTVTWTKIDGSTTQGTSTYGYGGGTDHRGMPTSITDSDLGTTTASYGPGGQLTTQTLSTGLAQTFTTDPSGDTTATAWKDSSSNLFLSDTQISDIHGRTSTAAIGGADGGWTGRGYTYDQASRLTQVRDTGDDGNCTTRTYTLDNNSNRTGSTQYPAIPTGSTAGSCTTTTTPTRTQTLSYDNADRLLSSGSAAGTTYDAWGRTTTLPASLTSTPGAGDTAPSFYANDIVRSITQGTATRTWNLDPSGRPSWMSTTGLASTAESKHYSDIRGDSPAWVSDTNSTGTVTVHRYIVGLAGMLADIAITGAVTTKTVQLTNIHGDVLRTTAASAVASPDGYAVNADEFGNIRDTSGATTPGPRYGWLGGEQRAVDTGTSGLTLMGVRLYAPTTGRFLSVDPVFGGNENAYSYPTDPIQNSDLNGRSRRWHANFGAGDLDIEIFRTGSPGWELYASIENSSFRIFHTLFKIDIYNFTSQQYYHRWIWVYSSFGSDHATIAYALKGRITDDIFISVSAIAVGEGWGWDFWEPHSSYGHGWVETYYW